MGNTVEITEASESRTIKNKAYRYWIEQEDPIRPGQAVTVQQMAYRGQEVKLRPVDARRGDALGAFFTDEEIKAGAHRIAPGSEFERAPEGEREPEEIANREDTPEAVDLRELDEEQISSWLQGEGQARKPSIPQVIAAVEQIEDEGDRAAVAQAVIDAERAVPDRDERSSLVEKLDSYTEE